MYEMEALGFGVPLGLGSWDLGVLKSVTRH